MRLLLFSILLVASGHLRAQADLSTGIESLQAGKTQLILKTSCAGEQPFIQFIHVHENEQTAADAAYKMLEQYGKGCFVTWQCYGDRYINFKLDSSIYKFDPNRIYTAVGRKETLTANGEYSPEADSVVENIATIFLNNYINGMNLVVALHNNTDAGGLTINSYKKGGDYAHDAKKVHVNKRRDQDDFLLTTHHYIYNYLKAKGFNVLLQNNQAVKDDGSLSVYAAQKNIPYINIEAEHGHLKEQLEMIDAVEELIGILEKESVIKYSHKLK